MLGCIIGKNTDGIWLLASGEYTNLLELMEEYKELDKDLEIKIISIDEETLNVVKTNPECMQDIFSMHFDF